MQVLKEKLEGSLNVFVQIMVINIRVNLSNIVVIMVSCLREVFQKTPQHNGVAATMNKTICKRIRCMLSHSKLPKHFWSEAMRTVVDLKILFSLAPLDGDIPDRVWAGKDISYKHFRVFGCWAYVHIPKDE